MTVLYSVDENCASVSELKGLGDIRVLYIIWLCRLHRCEEDYSYVIDNYDSVESDDTYRLVKVAKAGYTIHSSKNGVCHEKISRANIKSLLSKIKIITIDEIRSAVLNRNNGIKFNVVTWNAHSDDKDECLEAYNKSVPEGTVSIRYEDGNAFVFMVSSIPTGTPRDPYLFVTEYLGLQVDPDDILYSSNLIPNVATYRTNSDHHKYALKYMNKSNNIIVCIRHRGSRYQYKSTTPVENILSQVKMREFNKSAEKSDIFYTLHSYDSIHEIEEARETMELYVHYTQKDTVKMIFAIEKNDLYVDDMEEYIEKIMTPIREALRDTYEFDSPVPNLEDYSISYSEEEPWRLRIVFNDLWWKNARLLKHMREDLINVCNMNLYKMINIYLRIPGGKRDHIYGKTIIHKGKLEDFINIVDYS